MYAFRLDDEARFVLRLRAPLAARAFFFVPLRLRLRDPLTRPRAEPLAREMIDCEAGDIWPTPLIPIIPRRGS